MRTLQFLPPSPLGVAHAAPAAVGPLLELPARDARGRALQALRISVTDRCNFRCTYCMPRAVFNAHYRFLPPRTLLSFAEITHLVHAFLPLGVQKIRLTGGEPFLRKHLVRLVEMLSTLRTLAGRPLTLTMTTNASLLARYAVALKSAGLERVTVSLDALDPAIFARMSDAHFTPDAVLRGIDAAAQADLGPIKVNMVLRRGINDSQILPMVRRFRHSGHILRFIEYMDVGNTNAWNAKEVFSSQEVLTRINALYPLLPVQTTTRAEVAQRWQYADGAGEIGLISSVTHPFCEGCTRARLSPEGKLFLCLFAHQGHDLRALLRAGGSRVQLTQHVRDIWNARRDNYSAQRGRSPLPTRTAQKVEMSYIGG
jgi:cyclic pyranopterin phosphate synthase